MAQVDLFPAPPRTPLPAPLPARPAPPPFVPDVEGARHREARITTILRASPATLEQILRRSYRPGLEPLSQSAAIADLRCLADAGALVQHPLYALPGPLTGRWMTAGELRGLERLLADLLPATPPGLLERLEAARATLAEGNR